MNINSTSELNTVQSSGMDTIPYVSCIHNPVELPYIQWFEWAEKQEKKSKKQKQCPICKKWFYTCEY